MDVFILIILILLILISFFKPIVGLYLFIFVAYIRPQDFYPFLVEIEPVKWIMLTCFISFLFHKFNSREKFVGAKQNWGILGILLSILISRISAIDAAKWSQATQDFIVICMAYFLIINLLNTTKKLRNFYLFFVFINLIIALRSFISYKTGTAVYYGGKPGDLSLGFFANPDNLGLGMAVALAYSIVPICYGENVLIKGIFSIISGCIMVSALATDSRGAYIGIFTVFIIAVISQLRLRKILNRKFFIGLLMVLLLFTVFAYKFRFALKNSYDSISNEEDTGRIGRMATWTAAQLMIRDNLIFGVGRGNFVAYWEGHYPPGVYGYQVAHNIIYEVTAETGIIGLLFYLYFSLYGLIELKKLNKYIKKNTVKTYYPEMIFTIYLVGLFAFYVSGMFITVAYYLHIYVLVALFVSAKNIFMKQVAYAK